jgi:formate dehydrogenase assembly factor FdhD
MQWREVNHKDVVQVQCGGCNSLVVMRAAMICWLILNSGSAPIELAIGGCIHQNLTESNPELLVIPLTTLS